MKIQFTLLVEESKQLIALGTTEHPKMKRAFEKGKIVLKGSTTVSLRVKYQEKRKKESRISLKVLS